MKSGKCMGTRESKCIIKSRQFSFMSHFEKTYYYFIIMYYSFKICVGHNIHNISLNESRSLQFLIPTFTVFVYLPK